MSEQCNDVTDGTWIEWGADGSSAPRRGGVLSRFVNRLLAGPAPARWVFERPEVGAKRAAMLDVIPDREVLDAIGKSILADLTSRTAASAEPAPLPTAGPHENL